VNKISFITPPDAMPGFSLSGVDHFTAQRQNVMDVLDSATGDADTGLVVIDERLVDAAVEEKLTEIEHRWSGILLILPAPERPGVTAEDYAVRLIRRAIGYHVRLGL
jgi:V/A-type H+-transporting ATPase subunit F